MRSSEHLTSLSSGLRILGISWIEAWLIFMTWTVLNWFVPGIFSIAGIVLGYAICVIGDEIEPRFIESALTYVARGKFIKKS